MNMRTGGKWEGNDEVDDILERGRHVELVHYKMQEELPSIEAGIWEKHFSATGLLLGLCRVLAKGTPEEAMVDEILNAYMPFAKPYHTEPRPRFD
jgi:hypothetical protein